MILKGKTKEEVNKEKATELAQQTITELKKYLSETDYVIIKLQEGYELTDVYKSILEKRKLAREKINKLEAEL